MLGKYQQNETLVKKWWAVVGSSTHALGNKMQTFEMSKVRKTDRKLVTNRSQLVAMDLYGFGGQG